MGRARRREPVRIFPRGPAQNCPPDFPMLRRWAERPAQEDYLRWPQGPPLLEDGEDNPEAQEIASMALGQIGRDMQGRSFQLLAWRGSISFFGERQIPEFLLMRSMDDDVVFLLPGRKRETLLRASVAYPFWGQDTLSAYARFAGRSEKWEEGLWLMRERGYWDLQVRDGDLFYTQIGPWVLTDQKEGARYKRKTIESAATPLRAREKVERVAEDIETNQQIRDWQRLLEAGKLPPPEDATDELRLLIRLFLLQEGDEQALVQRLRREQGSSTDETAVLLQAIRESVQRLSKNEADRKKSLPSIWRMTSMLRL